MKITLQFILQHHLKQVSTSLCSSLFLWCHRFFSPLFSLPGMLCEILDGEQMSLLKMENRGPTVTWKTLGLWVQTHAAWKVQKTACALIQYLLAALTLLMYNSVFAQQPTCVAPSAATRDTVRTSLNPCSCWSVGPANESVWLNHYRCAIMRKSAHWPDI